MCEYVYQKCVWRSYGTEIQKEEEKPLKREFRDGDGGVIKGVRDGRVAVRRAGCFGKRGGCTEAVTFYSV